MVASPATQTGQNGDRLEKKMVASIHKSCTCEVIERFNTNKKNYKI